MVKERVQIEMDNLKLARSLEEFVETEDRIAVGLGEGFLQGDFTYGYVMESKGQVEEIEAKRRKILAQQKEPRMMRSDYIR